MPLKPLKPLKCYCEMVVLKFKGKADQVLAECKQYEHLPY